MPARQEAPINGFHDESGSQQANKNQTGHNKPQAGSKANNSNKASNNIERESVQADGVLRLGLLVLERQEVVRNLTHRRARVSGHMVTASDSGVVRTSACQRAANRNRYGGTVVASGPIGRNKV